jgi:hypothetical protein
MLRIPIDGQSPRTLNFIFGFVSMGKYAQREVARYDFAAQRRAMVEHHIAARGVRSESVLRAMRAVRREEFLPSNLREFAYEDSPLPITSGQTISQPYIVAFMIEALLLEGGEEVLEIGTGSALFARKSQSFLDNVIAGLGLRDHQAIQHCH